MKNAKQTKTHVTGRSTLGNQTSGTPFIIFKRQSFGLAVTLRSLEALRAAGLAASVWKRLEMSSPLISSLVSEADISAANGLQCERLLGLSKVLHYIEFKY